MKKMNKRHRTIVQALWSLGGQATLAQLSKETKLNVNGLSQSMSAIAQYVKLTDLGGKGRDRRYKIEG